MATRWSTTDAPGDGRSQSDDRHLRITTTTGIGLLVFTKGLDAATTAFALTYVPWIHEGNPLVAAVFGELGAIPGIVALSVVGLVALVAATEFIAANVDDDGNGYADLVRLIGYVPSSALFLILGIHNAVLILTGVSMFAGL